jgi:tetratricopeptide (TPR) repeat protein
MKSISKLKDDARKHELREEWDKAVQVYLQVLAIGEHGEAEVELPLYNRVGDLYVRLGRPNDAVRYYEQAADRYADAGLYNNAIALCNKAMRYQPQQLSLLRKLGMFSALQGFHPDARRYFVEYADKQIAHGKVDDALSALADFARIADDAESRELLGRRLHERGRTADAVVELRVAHGLRLRSGQTEQAEALRREIKSIDPSARFEPDQQPPSSSYGAELPGLASFEPDAFGGPDVERSASANVQLDDDAGGFGMVEIAGFDDVEEPQRPGGATTFDSALNFKPSVGEPDDGFFGAVDDTQDALPDDSFDLPLLADADADAMPPGGFGVQDFEMELPPDKPVTGEFDDFDAGGFDLPLSNENPSFAVPTDAEQAPPFGGENDVAAASWLDAPDEEAQGGGPAVQDGAFEQYDDLDVERSRKGRGRGSFAGWPEDPDSDLGTPPEIAAPSAGRPPQEPPLEVNLDDFAAWNQDPSEIEEMALEAAAASERALREAAEAERLEEEARAAADREAAAREAAEAEARETAAREAAVREAAAREEREQMARTAEEREAVRDPWAPEPPAPARPAEKPPRGASAPPAMAPPPSSSGDDRYVDLGSMFAEDATESTRFRIHEALPTGDEDQDFAELLSRFKEKVAEHLPPEDAAAHYDLGLAFKEMGLIDEAIAEFQVALRTGHMRLKVYEELGYCFLHKRQYNIAEKVLRQALQLEYGHELELLGIYYQLGRAYEAMGHLEQARDAYERVLGMDLHFQDTSERLARL